MPKRKKLESKRKSTIGLNPLEQIHSLPGKGKRAARFKDEGVQTDIKEVLLRRPKSKRDEGTLSKWIKSVQGLFG